MAEEKSTRTMFRLQVLIHGEDDVEGKKVRVPIPSDASIADLEKEICRCVAIRGWWLSTVRAGVRTFARCVMTLGGTRIDEQEGGHGISKPGAC